MGVRQVVVRAGDFHRLNQRAKLKVDRVHIRVLVWIVAEAAVGSLTGQSPTGRAPDRRTRSSRIPAQLAQDEHGVEARVHVPIMRLQVPAAVRLLIAQNTLHNGVRARCGLADEPKEMHHVEGRRHVVAQVTVRGLVLRDVAGDGVTIFRRKRLSQRRAKQRIEAQRVPRKLLEGVVLKEPLHDVGTIEFRLCTQGAQAHRTLRSVVENGKVGLWVELSLKIDEHAVRLLMALDKVHGSFRVRQLPSQRFGQRCGVGDRGQVAGSRIRIAGVLRIG